MARKNRMDLGSLCSGILFCISLVALIIACLAYTKKNRGGEYYKGTEGGGVDAPRWWARGASCRRGRGGRRAG